MVAVKVRNTKIGSVGKQIEKTTVAVLPDEMTPLLQRGCSKKPRDFKQKEILENGYFQGLQVLRELREEDLNLRPTGYEPVELPAAPPRDIKFLLPILLR